MTRAEELAGFVAGASWEGLSAVAREQIKSRVLDALGCAFGALDGEPIAMVRAHLKDFGGAQQCTLVGGGRSAPDRAAFYNGALVRYLDFNDSYLGARETCHPSDSLGAALAAGEYAGRGGRELLTALAVAYQIQCRLSDVAPVRARGFDHTVQLVYAVAGAVAKLLGLTLQQTAHALAIAGTAFNALRVTRTGHLSHWKGLAAPNAACAGTHAAFLAMRGITGPLEVFEGNKGLMDSITGRFEIDWSREDLEAVTRTSIKKYNSEFHSQSAVEAALELQRRHGFAAEDVRGVEVEIFRVAYDIIGGGEEGDKREAIVTKEQADHSLPYILAAALLDGGVMPEQYAPERIGRPDVQKLLRRIVVRPEKRYEAMFPKAMPCKLMVTLNNGSTVSIEKQDYEGFYSRPMPWEQVVQKFNRLSEGEAESGGRQEIEDAVAHLENLSVADLMRLLGQHAAAAKR